MRRLLLIPLLFILVGCSNVTDKHDFKEALDALEASIQIEDWKVIEEHAKAIKSQYEHSKWKLQLLGDEDEYESLQESINHLVHAANTKDKSDLGKEITTIKTYLEQIYSL